MPDYIYLLENRLSADQQNALRLIRDAAREAGMILFMTGDAVRDLTSGHAVRDLEIAVHGNALKLKKTIAKLDGKTWGEDEASRSLYLCFPGTVRVDVVSTHRSEFTKPGKPVFHQASIHDDLRRRDFTVNAMAISLNEGSYGLLMDPLNGVADIEARTLRLVSNYGFLQDPSLLIRATRYRARLGWELDPKTQIRYENARNEGVIEFLSAATRSKELEQIGHEEEGLKVLRALESEGWLKLLFPVWTSAKADEEKLGRLHDLAVELLLQGVHPDMSAAQMQLLTAKLTSREVTSLKKQMLRPGFVEEWNSLDALAAGFAKVLLSKKNSSPSVSFKLFMSYDPEAILWLGFTSKDAAVRERYNLFLKVWPEARQRIPYALMQELRITQELPAYNEIVQSVFLELIDGRLTTPEEMRAFLEPYSPPAPPPQVTIKRPRVKRSEAKLREPAHEDDEEAVIVLDDEDLDGIGGDAEIDLGLGLPKVELDHEIGEDVEDELKDEEHVPVLAPVKHAPRKSVQPKPAKGTPPPAPVPVPAPKKAEKAAAAAPVAKSVVKAVAKPVAKAKAKPVVTAKAPAKKPVKAKAKPVVKVKAKPPVKAKSPVKVKAKLVVKVKAPAKKLVKAKAKKPVKSAIKVKATPAKSAPAKGKSAPAKKSKAGKAKAKPTAKKAASKSSKKR